MSELKRLREPFPASAVGKLPRATCRDCSQSSSRVCAKHEKRKCIECGAYMTSAHIHLDYVGHAAVTSRLLDVDPQWTWEPAAWDEAGLPLMGRNTKGDPVTLWIKLTVGGVVRLGVGTCEAGAFDPEKQLIGDAIRNAAMRFGVALDLWSKEDLSETFEHAPTAEVKAEKPRKPKLDTPAPEPTPAELPRAANGGTPKSAYDEPMGFGNWRQKTWRWLVEGDAKSEPAEPGGNRWQWLEKIEGELDSPHATQRDREILERVKKCKALISKRADGATI